jgi:hypothetical protein
VLTPQGLDEDTPPVGWAALVRQRVRSIEQGVILGSALAFVRSQTFRPRADLDMLFVAVDITRGAILKAWLIPSGQFAAVLSTPDTRGRFRFVASMKEAAQDRWVQHRFEAEQLAPAILARLNELEAFFVDIACQQAIEELLSLVAQRLPARKFSVWIDERHVFGIGSPDGRPPAFRVRLGKDLAQVFCEATPSLLALD